MSNIHQTNCPSTATCSTSGGCSCPRDLNGDTGVLINQFTGYQCAYPHGACTWDFVRPLQIFVLMPILCLHVMRCRVAFSRTPLRPTVLPTPYASSLVPTTERHDEDYSGITASTRTHFSFLSTNELTRSYYGVLSLASTSYFLTVLFLHSMSVSMT